MFLHAMGGRWEGLPHCCEYVQVCEASSFITGTGRIGIVLIALISVYLQTHCCRVKEGKWFAMVKRRWGGRGGRQEWVT